jgi:non-ribosomal peptide synthetase component F
VAADWHIQATVGMVGCVSAGLDEHAPTPERVAIVLQLAERALARLRERGDLLPSTWLNSLGLGGPGATFARDLPTEVFTRVGETFIRLLRGEIGWHAATSPVL